MAIGMVVQIAYFFTDLYFVSMLGNAMAAGVTSAGNLWFLVLALTQILNVGTAALVSHAVGAQQHDRANLVFNQSLMLSVFMGLFVLVGVYAVARPYMHAGGRRCGGRTGGHRLSDWFTPGLGHPVPHDRDVRDPARHGHREADDDHPVDHRRLNILLRAVLIVGWRTGKPYGAFGRGTREHASRPSSA